MTPKLRILICAGEQSGENLAGPLIRYLKSDRNYRFDFFGTGGDLMAKEGVKLLAHIRDLEVIGFEIFKKLPFFFRLLDTICQHAQAVKTDLAILIDYPGFHLKLAQKLKELSIPVVFYVAPQVWAWRYSRVKKMRNRIDLLLLLFEFEERICEKEGIPAFYVGHPVCQDYKDKLQLLPDLPAPKMGNRPVVTIMPGSRSREIEALLPLMSELMGALRRQYPQLRVLLPFNNLKQEQHIRQICQRYRFEAYYDMAMRCVEKSDLVILASGTATLEVALAQKPMIIVYKVGLLTYLLGKSLIRIPYIGMVNIMANRKIIPEFIQSQASVKKIMPVAQELLDINSAQRLTMIKDLRGIAESLCRKDASRASSQAILDFIHQKLKK